MQESSAKLKVCTQTVPSGGRTTGYHRRSAVSFYLVTDGCIRILLQGREITVRENEGAFVNSGVLHSMESAGADAAVLQVTFPPEYVTGAEDPRLIARYADPIVKARERDCIPSASEANISAPHSATGRASTGCRICRDLSCAPRQKRGSRFTHGMCMRETASEEVSMESACAAGAGRLLRTKAANPLVKKEYFLTVSADAPCRSERRPFFICGPWQAAARSPGVMSTCRLYRQFGQWLRWLLPAPSGVTSRPQTLQGKLSRQGWVL